MIHDKAHVTDIDRIHPSATVYQFASVTGGTVIGARTVVWPFACLHGPVIGENCRIASGVAMGPGFLIGNDVFVGPNTVLVNDRWPRVHKAGYDPAVFDWTRWSVIIEDGASIGANCVIGAGVKIGKNAMIPAGTVLKHSVPDNCTVKASSRDYTFSWAIEDETAMRDRRMKFVE